MARLAALALASLLVVGCAADEVGSDHGTLPEDPTLIGTSTQAITTSEIIARAEEWIALRVPYCGGVRGGTDYICGGTCSRPSAPWDKYRTDCSGYVSWCWQIASVPTTAQYMSDRSGVDGWSTVAIDSMKAGDAVVCDGHIKLFSKFVSATSMEIYEEYDCGKVARKTVQSFTRSGNTLKFTYDARTYHPIRRNSLTPDIVIKGALDKGASTVEGWAVDMNNKAAALSVDVQIDAHHFATTANTPRPDVAAALSVDPNHGFVLNTPLFFCDGREHPAKATAASVVVGSATLKCPLPAMLPGVLRHVTSPTSLAAWKLDTMKHLRWVSPADRDSYDQVAELPATPEARRTPDGKVWIVDGTTRRHVIDPSAWSFDDKSILAISDVDAMKLNEGLPFPERPVLVQAVGAPEVFILDTRADAPITADPIGDPVNDDSPTPPSSSADQTTDMRGSCAYGGNAPNPWWAALLALAAMRLRRTS
jgi:hypothetical protein